MAAQRINPLPGATRDPSSEAVRVWLVMGNVCAALFVIDLFTVQSGYGTHTDRSISLTIHRWFGGSTFGVLRRSQQWEAALGARYWWHSLPSGWFFTADGEAQHFLSRLWPVVRWSIKS
jgi:hypothetical protein